VHLEHPLVLLPDVLGEGQCVEVLLQGTELRVFAAEEGEDRDAVLFLHFVGVPGIVHQHHVLQVPVDHPEVLHELVLVHDAAASVKPVLE
jgi:hypothetical protein